MMDYGCDLNSSCHPELVSGSKYKFVQNFKKFAAFTLAEVLITLGIIGIVAAITIPTLVSNYKQRAWNTAATVFERKLEEALKTMNTQQVLAGYRSTEEFVNALSKYFKITKICSNDNLTSCFENKITWNIIDISSKTESEEVDMSSVKSAADLGQDAWGTRTVGVQFANGTSGIIAYNPSCSEQPFTNQFSGTSCVSLVYDTDGFKSPNTFNKDVRGINSFLRSCAFKSGSTCFSAPFIPTPITRAECEELKSDLGITTCYFDNDYWAGAVKACGGINKMATLTQLGEIANYIYNTQGIGDFTDTNLSGAFNNIKRDNNKVAELGLRINLTNIDGFFIWAGQEHSYTVNGTKMENLAYYRGFNLNNTTYAAYYRDRTNNQAICIGQ